MNIDLDVTGNTHTTVRFNVVINGGSTGELQVKREDFTRLCDLIFQEKYRVSKPKP